jgi:ketosteroid isomerase-like protein
MPDLTNEEVARQYAEAATRNDLSALDALRHPDWQVIWPQSGEKVVRSRDFTTIVENYPGGHARTSIRRVVGAEDRWVVTPGNTVLRIAGSGDFWWGEWSVTYPDGRSYLCIDLFELRDGRVWRETVYWAEPIEAPDWRRQWVQVGSAD